MQSLSINRLSSESLFRIAVILVSILVAVLCKRLLLSAFTSGDDGYTAFAAIAPGGVWASAVEMAKFQGRFYQLVLYPLAMLPFVGESIVVANLFKIYTFLMVLAGFWCLCRELIGRAAALVCLALFVCLFDTVGGSYNPFHGLPLWFGLGCALVMFSLGLLLRSFRKQTSPNSAYFVFFLALLSYEILLLYVPLFMLFHFYNGESNSPRLSKQEILKVLLRCRVLFYYVAAYLVLYAGYKHFYPGTYSGVDGLTFAPANEMLRPILNFSLRSLYFRMGQFGQQAFSPSGFAFAIVGVAAVLSAWGAASSATGDSARRSVAAQRITAAGPLILVLLGYVFVPNVLFGFTLRYRIWAGDGVEFYLGSFFSAFAFVLLLYVFLSRLMAFPTDRVVRYVGVMTLAFLLGSFVYSNSKNSENFFEQSRTMSIRWPVADWVSDRLREAPVSRQLPSGTAQWLICGDGFSHNLELPTYFRNPDMIADVEVYWSRYFSRNLGRDVKYVNKRDASAPCAADFSMSYEKRTGVLIVAGEQRTKSFDN